MISTRFGTATAALAAFGLVLATSVSAAAPLRSADALPVLAGPGSVPFTEGAQNGWHCAQVSDEALKLDKKFVQVDEAGQVVVNGEGSPYACHSASGSYQAGPFPLVFFLALLGAGGATYLVTELVKSDSPG